MSFLSQAIARFTGQGETRSRSKSTTAAQAHETEPEWWEVSDSDRCDDEENPPSELEGVDTDGMCEHLLSRLERNQFSLIEIPDNILRIIQLLQGQEFDYDTVEELASSSPVLAGELVKMANSAAFNRSGVKIANLRVALPRLGPNRIKAVLYFNCANRQLANNPLFRSLATGVVDHSRSVAGIAAHLSRQCNGDADTAFLAGLLHDIGKLAICKELAENYTLPSGTAAALDERNLATVFETFHERIGMLVGQLWNLSDEVLACIGYHHHFSDAPADIDNARKLSALIGFSNRLEHQLSAGQHAGEFDPFSLPECAFLGLSADPATIRCLRAIPEICASSRTDE